MTTEPTPLDLDAIRARHAEAVRATSSWAYALVSASDVPTLLDEIERLESPFAGPNWMAGGRWEVEYWREGAGMSFPASHEPSPEANRKRYVWRGPDEPFDYAEHACAEAEWERDEAAATMRAEDDDAAS